MTDILLRHDRDNIATLTLNRPEVRNALSMGLMEALDAELTAILIPAERARELGLVNRVVPAAELHGATQALAGQLAAKSPLTVAIGKAAFYRQAEMDLASAYDYASGVMTQNMLARDAEEG